MTDKQIIIDDVDVSGCINFRPDADTAEASYTNACFIGLMQRWYSNLEPSCIMSCSCKYNPDCYYKQFKQKEQECEELKEQCKKYGEINEQETKDYAELKAENDELKQFLSKEPLAIQALQSTYSDYKKRSEVFFEMIGEYKQTLAEIKPILEFYANTTLGEKQKDGSYKLDLTFPDVLIPCPYIKYDPNPAKEALRKINECEGDNEV